MDAPKLDYVIKTATTESEIHRALEIYPWVIMEVVTSSQSFVVSQFELSNEYRADFVVADSFSGGWELHFIELELPFTPPFNQSGNPSKRLAQAAGQIRRWKEFERRHDKRPNLVSQLRDAIVRKDLAWADGREPTDSAGYNIMWPDSVLVFHYHVIIGRRSQLPSGLMARKAAFVQTDGFEVITYDRVLEVYEKQRNSPIYEGTVRLPGQRPRNLKKEEK